MALRIGFDMDGVLADFSAAYFAVEDRLFGKPEAPTRAGDPEEERSDGPPADDTDQEPVPAQAGQVRELRRRKDAVWKAIRQTPDFWLTLAPTDPEAVRRIHQLMLQHRWEVFFITQRPATLGETVQRQTQRWLLNQGFDMPSVLVVPGSRGAAAAALTLDYLVDDSPKNCIDVKSESKAKPILIVEGEDKDLVASARRLGIETAASIAQVLDALEQARSKPGILERLAQFAGLR
jgi:hypothetical protein